MSAAGLRIAHLIDLDKVGGVESMYVDFLRATPPDGLPVRHFTIADSPRLAPRFLAPVLQASEWLATPRHWGPLKLPRRPRALRAARRLQLIRRARPDLVIAWNQFTDFRRDRLDLGCPLVYYEHGMSWYSHAPGLLAGFLPHVSLGIGVSRAATRMLALKHAPAFPLALCRNPVRPGLLPPLPPRRDLPTGGRPLRLGVAGRLVPLKAVGLAVLAVKELRARGVAAELLVAGSGPEQAAIEALIRREGLGAHVRLLGLVADMAGFYRDLDLFLSTSMHETMPLVCLEAMAWGLPVIASRVDGFPEVVQDGVNGRLVQSGDNEAFTHAVVDTLRDSGRRFSYARGAASSAQRFGVDAHVRRLIDCYRMTLAP